MLLIFILFTFTKAIIIAQFYNGHIEILNISKAFAAENKSKLAKYGKNKSFGALYFQIQMEFYADDFFTAFISCMQSIHAYKYLKFPFIYSIIFILNLSKFFIGPKTSALSTAISNIIEKNDFKNITITEEMIYKEIETDS